MYIQMELSYKDMNLLLKQFPTVKLCYEKRIHNTVLNKGNFYLSIPKGYKFFAWFKNFKSRSQCFLLKIGKNKKSISSIHSYKCSFNSILSSGKGTIFYGTVFRTNNINFFNIEDMYYFKGNPLSKLNKIQTINYIYNTLDKYLKQDFFTKKHIIFGMPLISDDYKKLKNELTKLNYDIYSIQCRNNNQRNFFNEVLSITKEKINTFLVKPTIKTDIYELFVMNNNKLEKYNDAFIPTYKLSVYMNSLFRNIRENNDLDFIEESDDEEDFENVSLDKYVNLNKEYKMKCVYNNKYKLWTPLNISEEPIVNKKNL